jgi:TPP-dependent trihydroxycyclohexane-1,2-dione (THcHDO) dehydratase
MGLAFALLPRGATFHNQTLWGSIGWATPAAFGAAVAASTRRVVLVTGDGSHQLTAQEISQFGRRGLKPIVFLLNNSGYLIERLICEEPAAVYNDIASWRQSCRMRWAAKAGSRLGSPPAASSIKPCKPPSKAALRHTSKWSRTPTPLRLWRRGLHENVKAV